MNPIKEKYSVPTAVSMVIGCVIGSGVFFKAESISRITGGNTLSGVLAWCIGGLIMLVCLLMFAVFSLEYGSEGGIIGYAQKTVGKTFAYYSGWFMAAIYYPSLVSVLSWLSARYTLLFFGSSDSSGGLCMLLSCLYLILSFIQNALLPKFAGKFQIATTAIKLVPLTLMITGGIFRGISSGVLSQNFSGVSSASPQIGNVFSAVVASAFAYEGWIAATSIGTELKNSRKNLAPSLIIGGVCVMLVYVLYFLGISGAVSSETLVNYSSGGIRMAFNAVLGNTAGAFLTAFVAVSCLGALNGMMFGCGRAMYNLSVLESNTSLKLFSKIDSQTATPLASFCAGLFFSVIWLFFYYGAQISDTSIFFGYSFDSSELPVISIYSFYIPMFFMFIRKHRHEKPFTNLILPSCAICACIFMIISAIWAHGIDFFNYMLSFISIMLFGCLFKRGNVNND